MIGLILVAALVAPLGDPAAETRARALEAEIRCVVCENEPISQSTAEIAADMRREVRDQIEAGRSDVEIRNYFRERYGDFVLLRPPLDPRTWALWAAPPVLSILGLLLVWTGRRRSQAAPDAPEPATLTEEER